VSKPFALGTYRADWITKRGKRVLRINGGVNKQGGVLGMDMSPYIAKAFADWLCTEWPAPETEGQREA
jgi:hypothetical protein